MKTIISIWILLLCTGIAKVRAQNDPVLAGMILLYLSIRYYTLNDAWNNVTAGMIDRSNGEVARLAMSRWRRAAATAR